MVMVWLGELGLGLSDRRRRFVASERRGEEEEVGVGLLWKTETFVDSRPGPRCVGM